MASRSARSPSKTSCPDGLRRLAGWVTGPDRQRAGRLGWPMTARGGSPHSSFLPEQRRDKALTPFTSDTVYFLSAVLEFHERDPEILELSRRDGVSAPVSGTA